MKKPGEGCIATYVVSDTCITANQVSICIKYTTYVAPCQHWLFIQS